MQTYFLTRRQYDRLVDGFKVDPEMLAAYNAAARTWTAEGVKIRTDNVQLIQILDQHIRNN